MTDIKDVAEPWTDPLGNVLCVVSVGSPLCTVEMRRLVRGEWVQSGYVPTYTCNADLLRGLGRTLPPVPTPKKVAGAVKVVGSLVEYAVKGGILHWRNCRGDWWMAPPGPLSREGVAAAHAAFQQAGDVLPGEEGK